MKYIKLLTVAVLWLPCFPTHAEAARIHAVLVADSNDATIGEGAASNTVRLRKWLKSSATTLGMKLNIKVIDGNAFSCQAISTAVKTLNAGQDDVILFYYSGHGFRTVATTTPFPDFYCGAAPYTAAAAIKHKAAGGSSTPAGPAFCDLSGQDPFCNLAGLASTLSAKGARLTLAFADTCNVLMPLPEEVVPQPAAPQDRRPQLTTLLLSSRGTLIMSGSVPTQYSWYLPTGGFFTTQLVNAIDVTTKPGASGKWSDVVTLATKEILVDADAVPPITQRPQAANHIAVAWMPEGGDSSVARVDR